MPGVSGEKGADPERVLVLLPRAAGAEGGAAADAAFVRELVRETERERVWPPLSAGVPSGAVSALRGDDARGVLVPAQENHLVQVRGGLPPS